MRAIATIIAASLWMCVDCTRAHAGEITTACRPVAEPIELAATEHRVPVLLLTALMFAESSCDPGKVNARTNAIGLGQLMITGAGQGYSANELRGPWLNAVLSAKYLATWKRRCGSWRGAVEVYGGRQHCKVRSKQGAKIIAIWKRLEKEMEPIV